MTMVKVLDESASFKDAVQEVSNIVAKISGNILGEKQAHMVENRLKKRMIDLGISNPADYLNYLNNNFNKESGELVSLMTTHHTFFFREFSHFDFIKNNLPKVVENLKSNGKDTVKVWSAACSRGQEVYSLGMFFEYHLKRVDPTMKYEILGSDIDPSSVKIASNGVYHRNEIKEIPMNYLGTHWSRGTGEIADYVKIKKSISGNCKFQVENLLQFSPKMMDLKFDFVFCRNVFIYFKQEQIQQITRNFLAHLNDWGFLFTGISESLVGLDLPIGTVGPSVYGHRHYTDGKPGDAPAVAITPAQPDKKKIIKVLCVDDSSTVRMLLKKIFTKDEGFEVVATANHGLDAVAKMKQFSDIDLMTLDIHMPEMDGVTYLEKNFNSSHPPVIMISSASRDDSKLALRALELGAVDFVEKPALNNLAERGEEIRAKARVASYDSAGSKVISSIDRDFTHKVAIQNPNDKLRIILTGLGDKKKFVNMLKDLSREGDQPPTFLLFEGHKDILYGFSQELQKDVSQQIVLLEDHNGGYDINKVYIGDFKTAYDQLKSQHSHKKTSMIMFGNCSSHAQEKIAEWPNIHLLVEDFGDGYNELGDIAADVIPNTSFAYESCKYLAEE